ncbi:ABC transporter substrate-binding protein [Microbacteriaceae bacterium VKM Ac-2855]|nr:ABC transporter substrate-binding protein [Microbacteriaceae bacterium VKM Ac-2855]
MLRSARNRSRPFGRVSAFAALLVAGAVALSACSGSTSADESAPAPNDGTLVIAGAAQPATFTFDVGAGGSYEILEFINNNGAGLIRYPYATNDAGETVQDYSSFEGVLAESYDVSEDGLTYTFHLRPGVVSQAGNPLTAEDVRWSFERKFATSTSGTKSVMAPGLTDPLSQIVVIDDATVSFTVPQAGMGFTLLSNLTVLFAHIYDSTLLKEHATTEDPYAVLWSQTNANFGFGAYELDTFTPGEEMVLTANPDFALGEPEVATIVYRVAAEAGTRASLLRNGDVDIAEELLPADQITLADEGVIELQDVKTNNLNTLQLVANKAPFDDVAVRQALDWAVPYDQIIENVYRGRAQRTVGILPTELPDYDDSGLESWDYDPEKAKEMLADAGYPDGVEFTLTVSNSVPDLQETAVQIQSFAADAGFTVNINEVAPTEVVAGRRDGTFESYLLRQQMISLAPNYVVDLWFKDAPTSNVSQWFSPEYRAIVAKGSVIADQLGPEAQGVWNEAQRMLIDQSPIIPIATVDPLSGFGAAVDGYAWRTDNILDYSQLGFTS